MKTRVLGGKQQVWDALRGKWLVLTPEEQVRQQFIEYLIDNGTSPQSIAQEQTFRVDGLVRRGDIVVYNGGQPWLLVECKAPHIELSQSVFEQVAQYNMVLGVPYIVVTNGVNTYCAQVDSESKSCTFLSELPLQ